MTAGSGRWHPTVLASSRLALLALSWLGVSRSTTIGRMTVQLGAGAGERPSGARGSAPQTLDGQVVTLPSSQEAPEDTSRIERRITVREGLRAGLFVTRAVTWYCGAVFCAFGVIALFQSASSFSAFLSGLIVVLVLISGYLIAFSLGGVAWAATSRLPRNRTCNAIRGFAIAASVCSVMAVVTFLIEGQGPDGGFVIKVSALGGLVGAAVGCAGRSFAHRDAPSGHSV